MIEGQVVTNIADLARGQTQKLELGGRAILVHNGLILTEERLKWPEPKELVLHTLSGLRDYIIANRDGLELSQASVHVVSPSRVALVGPLADDTGQRFTYAAAEVYDRFAAVQGFRFGTFMSSETMIIALHALFVATPARDEVLRLLSSVTQSAVRTDEDNSVAQAVTVRQGVSMERMQTVPNPVLLAPFRTFPEINQPTSPFVFRMKSSAAEAMPGAALFEADGGEWRDTATEAIRDWLETEVATAVAIIA